MDKIIAFAVVVLFGAIVGAATAAAFSLVMGGVFMLLWNYAAPVYWATAPQITFLQGVATITLLILVRGGGRMPDLGKKKV